MGRAGTTGLHRSGILQRREPVVANLNGRTRGLRQLSFALFLLALASLRAQQPAALVAWQGTLLGAAGSPIPQATIRLAGSGISAEEKTGSDGRFQLAPLPPGEYQLKVETLGRTIEYPTPINIAPAASPAVLTLTASGGLSVAGAPQAKAT